MPCPTPSPAVAVPETTTNRPCRVAILIVSFRACGDLQECLHSIFESDDNPLDKQVFVVDNGSDDGTAETIQTTFPQVKMICSETNLGFTGGNNLGWEVIQADAPDVDFLCLLNQDTIVKPGWLRDAVACLESHPQVAAVQSKLLLYPETTLLNTLGNRCQYLGFGYLSHYREADRGALKAHSISVASGAAITLRADLVRDTEIFDSRFFLYSEDLDLSWKLRLQGYDIWLEPESVVYHKYHPSAPYRHYYHLERNRWLLLLKYYRTPTLLLVTPALLLMEAGQWFFAMNNRLGNQRLEVYRYLLNRNHWGEIASRRNTMQQLRKISDRKLTADFTGGVHFDAIDSPLLRYIGNPILTGYWYLIRLILFW